jgi:predicted alpha/beta superfamily hydrolase
VKFITLLCIALLSITGNADAQIKDIQLGKIETIHSTILNQDKAIWIYQPPHYPLFAYDKPKYPVIYLLDGDANFIPLAAMMHEMCSNDMNAFCPQMILVGITNANRQNELTPSKAGSKNQPTVILEDSGGAEKFTGFLRTELIPHIEKNYPTAPHRTLIGHSLGGLFVMNTLTHHPELFNNYVAIDPSMWWDKQKLVRQFAEKLSSSSLASKSLFLAIANTLPQGVTLKEVKTKKDTDSSHIRSILKLQTVLKTHPTSPLRSRSKYYAEDNHGTVPMPAEYDAIRWLFDYYKLKNASTYFEKEFDGVRHLQKHFETVSKKMGYPVLPPGEISNNYGYNHLKDKNFARAEDYFSFNLKLYPNSANAHDSMGDYFVAINDKAKAIAAFEKSMSLNKLPETEKKLAQLRESK